MAMKIYFGSDFGGVVDAIICIQEFRRVDVLGIAIQYGGNYPSALYSYSQDVDSSELLDADNRIDDPSKGLSFQTVVSGTPQS